MGGRHFHTRFEDLPHILPVFPLSGVLLLPDGQLPLNVFEPRYLELVEDALASGRLIGMIQPLTDAEEGSDMRLPLYSVGCAGRISHFSETGDGRFLLTLTGLCRFSTSAEMEMVKGYRRFAVDWTPYRADLDEEKTPLPDRDRLVAVFRAYGALYGMDINWSAVNEASDQALTVGLPMACPFDRREKQALLECVTASERASMLVALMEMALAEGLRPNSALEQ